MRKMFLLFGMLATVGALFVACSEQQDPTSPEEASFAKNKVTYECSPLLQAQLDALLESTETILMDRKTLKGAISNIDNLARKICVEGEPNLEASLAQYYEFETLLNGQNVAKLVGGEVARQALLAMAYSFATGGDFNPGFSIPPEAVDGDGGLWVIQDPGEIPPGGLALVAGSQEGAVRILPGTFLAEDFPVTLVEYRLPDDYDGTGDGYSFGNYTPLPEIWFFDASVQPDPTGPGFQAWVCLVDGDIYPDLYNRSVIAHAKDGGTVELLPKLPEGDSPLNCDDADVQTALGPTSPGWLQLAGSVLKPVVGSIFGVKPLNAMFFAGKGLGGRGTSFSPHAGVEAAPAPAITYARSELNTGDFNHYHFNTTNWEDFPDELFVEEIPGYECPSRTVVEIYDAADNSLIQTYDCFGSAANLESFSFDWPVGLNPPDNIYIVLWDQLLDLRYRSNTVAITIVHNTLTIAGAGTGSGTVVRSPDIDCHITTGTADVADDCSHTAEEWVRYGTLTATPDAGSTFTGWSGAGCSGTGGCDVLMDSDRTATATFEADVQVDYTLEVYVIYDGGTGTVTDGTATCDAIESPCRWTYAEGTNVTLTGTATPSDPVATVIFTVDCAGSTGPGTAVCNLSMLGDRTTEVYFTVYN